MSGFQHQCIDVYGAVGVDGEEDTAKGQWRAVSRQSIATAIAALNPINWTEAPLRDGVPRACGRMPCMRQYERFERCVPMIEHEEARHGGVKYTWVIKTRPDVTIANPPINFTHFKPDRVYVDNKFRDVLVFIPRARLNRFAAALGSSTLVPCNASAGIHSPASCWGYENDRCANSLYMVARQIFGGRSWKGYQETGMCVRPLRTVESLQVSLLVRNSPDYNTRGLHNMGQASVNLSHNPAWFHRKAIQEFRVQLTCTKESTLLIKGTKLK